MVDETNTRMSPDLQLVCDYLSQEARRQRGDMHEVTPPKKKLRTLSHAPGDISQVEYDDVDLPLPLNDREYEA